jgi:hypothetical protein
MRRRSRGWNGDVEKPPSCPEKAHRRRAAGHAAIAERDIARLAGGSQILLSFALLRPLVDDLLSGERESAGAHGGWEALSRRGRPENLLASEHVHDDEEFLRRHVSAEQVYLAPGTAGERSGPTLALWELGAGMLGSPRLHALALLQAIALRCRALEQPCRISVNARAAVSLETASDLERLAAELPPPRPLSRSSWREVLEPRSARGGTVVWITSRRDPQRDSELRRVPAASCVSIVEIAPRRVRIWRRAGAAEPSEWTSERPWRSLELPVRA